MSDSEAGDKSYETTSESQDGEPSSIHQNSARQTPQSANAESGAEEEQQSGEELVQDQSQVNAAQRPPDASAQAAHSSRRQSRMKAPTYRHVLNEYISEISSQSISNEHQLGPSQIGASFWTSAEKERLFRKLARCGPGDLHVLSASVGTKSEAEINVYLTMLRAGVLEANAIESSREKSRARTAPAACEVGALCEDELETAADSLARSLARQCAQAEEEMYGEDWIIDAALADEIEETLQDTDESIKAEDGETIAEQEEGPGTRDLNVPFPSASLLRPSAFLQLSYDIYMAGTPGDHDRWFASGQNVDDLDEPAIFRSAFEDFYNLTVGLTRRLVQATIFQTMTRLRASDGSRMAWSPEPVVREKDVKAAVDILGIDVDAWKNYWARLPKRHGLIVYTDSRKYDDGRPGTKTGVGLSYEEVEAELGLNKDARPEGETGSIGEASLDEMNFDSDDFTVLSKSDGDADADNGDDGQTSAAEGPDVIDQVDETSDTGADNGVESTRQTALGLREQQWATRRLKRRRALSPISFSRAQDDYIDAVDMNASRDEERRLWQSVRKHPPDNDQLKPQPIPESPVLNGVLPTQTTNWRDKVKYEAPWERLGASVDDAEFAEMERCGACGRKRRRMFLEKVVEEGGLMCDDGSRPAGVEDGNEISANSESSEEDDEMGSGAETFSGDDNESPGPAQHLTPDVISFLDPAPEL